jgi:hypothetical protein
MTTSYQQPATSPRAAANRANSQRSTGPRTTAGKQRSSLNALRHGLTAASPLLPSEAPAAFEDHRRRFFDEYQPATPTESRLVQELSDTSWRLNRIPVLEAALFSQNPDPQTLIPLSPRSACTARASPGSSKRPSTSSARSKPPAPSASAASSKTLPPFSSSTNTEEFPGSLPTMASFFRKTKSQAAPSASST